MEPRDGMILCDIGNSRMHLYDGCRVEHLSHAEGLARYARQRVFFISVNESVRRKIGRLGLPWIDLSEKHLLKTAYKGLGIDREAACLGIEEGVVIDAGSAVTVDLMEEGRHLGGWIWPGLERMLGAYRSISDKLDVTLNPDVSLERLPLDTRDAVSFAMLGSIAALVAKHAKAKRVVVTGGDAAVIARTIPGAVIDETIVFKGMKKMIKDSEC
ncbi:type III pantothenate kinase [Hydrogenimonas urashimensis]|uniref:type III pantothenate kinase n=1 Tax=Hydrogenimonas urashimensis TaxID=2740515 RepID=UPI0019161D36|nr:type III pantothenate kinase [Hydrogenimonas urashimensis]